MGYHPWTDSLTTFVKPGFANQVALKMPLLAAMLKSFNDEFNADLIAPDLDKLFGKDKLDSRLRERFEAIAKHFKRGEPKSIEKYALDLSNDAELWARVKMFKKSTIKAFAQGGCDSPLCDELLFLYLWLHEHDKDALDVETGMWNFDKEKGFTTIQETGMFKAIRPKLKNPSDTAMLLKLRSALADELFDHLDRVGPGLASQDAD